MLLGVRLARLTLAWFVLVLDQPRHLLRGVGDTLVRERQMEQPAERIRIAAFGHRAQHPPLELVVHLVGRVFDRTDLCRQALVAEQDRAVRETDRNLNNPHSIVVGLVAETGLIGLLLGLGFVAAVAVALHRGWKPAPVGIRRWSIGPAA